MEISALLAPLKKLFVDWWMKRLKVWWEPKHRKQPGHDQPLGNWIVDESYNMRAFIPATTHGLTNPIDYQFVHHPKQHFLVQFDPETSDCVITWINSQPAGLAQAQPGQKIQLVGKEAPKIQLRENRTGVVEC